MDKNHKRNNKTGKVYLLSNATSCKFGATTSSIKNRIYFYNKNNKDKFNLIAFVESKDVFNEENNFRWFLADNHSYFMNEFFQLEDKYLFFEFFNERICKCIEDI